MDSKDQIINEISTAVENLSLKIETLQIKINELCKNTSDCRVVNNTNKNLIKKAEPTTKEKK